MAKVGSAKSAGWVAVILLSRLLAVIAQPGFLSIACEGKTNYSDENNIEWITDATYMDVGETADIGKVIDPASGSSVHNLRHFPKPLTKSCYQLPVQPNVHYLLRLWFAVGNYTGFQNSSSCAFSIETLGMLTTKTLTITNTPARGEKIFVSSGNMLYICLIRASETGDPFISAIELRTLQSGMYQHAKPGNLLSLSSRYDVGANSSVRYPLDKFDRLWLPDVGLKHAVNPDDLHYIQGANSEEPIPTNNTQDLPPSAVMQTAWVSSASLGGTNSLLLLDFVEIVISTAVQLNSGTFNSTKSPDFIAPLFSNRWYSLKRARYCTLFDACLQAVFKTVIFPELNVRLFCSSDNGSIKMKAVHRPIETKSLYRSPPLIHEPCVKFLSLTAVCFNEVSRL